MKKTSKHNPVLNKQWIHQMKSWGKKLTSKLRRTQSKLIIKDRLNDQQ